MASAMAPAMVMAPAMAEASEFGFRERPEAVRRRIAADTRAGLPSLWTVDAARHGAAAARLAPGVLGEEELGRAARFAGSRTRRCFLVAHVALRLLLGARLGTGPGAVRLVREPCPTCGGPHGRPAVDGAGTHFSLSHSGDLVLVGIAGTPVGVDVEEVPALDLAVGTSTLLHPAETAEVAAAPDHVKPRAFARAWVRKESYLKGLGTGLSRDPSLDYVGAGRLPAPGPPGWVLEDVLVPPGHVAAFAVRAPGHKSKLRSK
ncbi:4'-phosphopantetheinyl transferase family protein [Streptomyces sp. NBC_01244]|uniref:4'-phosphopantetheinyl transferase family protein n=1 Tax=Streptomyces sp. NBC_01244 TaxID=2903797 RepID=UPI002E0FE4DF|nr:4'-phosphopantetheinyl transferase superfamily protein [Streptomyces sp. NBC_01244]